MKTPNHHLAAACVCPSREQTNGSYSVMQTLSRENRVYKREVDSFE